MEHLLVRVRGRRLLLADVHRGSGGHGVGYGMTLIRMRRVLLLGRVLPATVFFVPSRSALNTAVTELESDDVRIVRPRSAAARALTALWILAAPFRIGDPWLWVRRTFALMVTGPFYRALEHSTSLPRRVRRFLIRQGPFYQRLKAVSARYAAKSDAAWHAKYRTHVLEPFRALEDAGRDTPGFRLRLPAEREAEASRQAGRLGIRPDAPIVTVHVRESGYRTTGGLTQRGWDDIRNARIEDFLRSFRALVERGYTVVRLGDPSMTPVTMPGVVDLATSPDRNPWLDIWCTMRSRFLIGCDSGPSWLAVLLDLPVLTVNAVHFRDASRPTDRILCKLARDRHTGHLLSVSEMLTEDFLRVGFKGDRYECVDNDPDDIQRAVVDMIEVIEGREQPSWSQRRFNRRLLEVDRQKLGASSALEGVAVAGRARGTLSRRFARSHFAPDDASPPSTS